MLPKRVAGWWFQQIDADKAVTILDAATMKLVERQASAREEGDDFEYLKRIAADVRDGKGNILA